MDCDIYNEGELKEKYGIPLEELLREEGIKILDELDGEYSLSIEDKNYIYLCRDPIGIKPLWYSRDPFSFSLRRMEGMEELDPRKILRYAKKTKKIEFIDNNPFRKEPVHEKPFELIKQETKELIIKSISKRIPDEKFGVLLSGGVDSTLISFVLKKLGEDFIAYSSVAEIPGMKEAEDLEYARKAAEIHRFELRVKKIGIGEVEKYIKRVLSLLDEPDVVNVGVGLPLYVSCEMAKEDGISILFSGLGSEEIFAGYERHKRSKDVNEECFSGIINIHKRDTYRDYVISKHHGIGLRLPFLDRKLVEYALRIPAEYKLKNGIDKFILREIAAEIGVDRIFAYRKKRAAQYGSNFDRAIKRLARLRREKKSSYLMNLKPVLGCLFSSGKDSAYALWIMKKRGYEIRCLINLYSENPDSYMFHVQNPRIVELQAEAMQIPLLLEKTKGEKEKELKDLEKALKRAKDRYGIEGVVTGALFSNYQRERIENICRKIDLLVFSPLWHMNQELEMRQIIKSGFEIIFTEIGAYGLDREWLGRKITEEDVDRLVELNRKMEINIAGEGGEFESLVLDAPFFKKRIHIQEYKIIENGKYSAKLLIRSAELRSKEG
ncbi:MAG: diphthine--ammonia ligase [Candidatus Syntropharchaeia archaeon]